MAVVTVPPTLVSVDLSRGERHDHPDIRLGQMYLARWDGDLFLGQFTRQHYGLNFSCDFGASGGFQFDTPGYNHSLWEALWEVHQ